MGELDAMIARIRELPELARRAAPDVADAVKAELARTIAAGTTAEGEPWPLTKRGERPLATAADDVRVANIGTRILARIPQGHIQRHHRGRAKGGIARRILPTGPIPPAMARVINQVVTDHFNQMMKGQ